MYTLLSEVQVYVYAFILIYLSRTLVRLGMNDSLFNVM